MSQDQQGKSPMAGMAGRAQRPKLYSGYNNWDLQQAAPCTAHCEFRDSLSGPLLAARRLRAPFAAATVKHLFVWVRGEGATFKLAGELAATDPAVGGRFNSEFEYSREWATDPAAFPLDPASLPLQSAGRRFQSEQFTMLFRHMAFNAAIGNVDDHLKNFWMLAAPSGYRLAPAFDLVPDVSGRGEHTLSFQYSFACPTRAQLRDVADEWKVDNPDGILDEVANAASRFTATTSRLRVRAGKAVEIIRADVRRRVKLIRRA
jgi:hypothetical protein